MQPSIWQLLIVAALVLILFGRGRISEMMGDVGKGIKSFKKGITDEDSDQREREQSRRDRAPEEPRRIEGAPAEPRTDAERERDRDYTSN
ncbi:twin-arginine translocase TatA/TatE family subunit [Novosphingopyxis iocasae]|uniref:twin-arginine translocase TatA/TatE family subunit n=1 Tax=Novosphingopyxis iocasae TaxID=2762729 RepID=UPI001651000E|nr:twin-arginine translocase TatA/TatE family subunit [Novosphingopyxis iocasae]|tara:strand:+ start:1948 stop:2217 length:270 start_codon:yes stop_codon:yes gene_type:complete